MTCKENGDVSPVENLTRRRNAPVAKFGDIVEAGGVYQYTRSEPGQFHRLEYRVGSGAGNIRNQRGVLSREHIYERRLAAVARPEYDYMHSVGRSHCLIHIHFTVRI